MKEMSLYKTNAVAGGVILSTEELKAHIVSHKAAGCQITRIEYDVKPVFPLMKFEDNLYSTDSIAKACNEGATDCMVKIEYVSSCRTGDYVQVGA